MSLNGKPCNTCENYAVISIGDGQKKAARGWCVPKSVYPAQEQPGQVFPPGVKRAPVGELAKPHIVVGVEIVPHCVEYREKAVPPAKPGKKR